MKQGQKTSAEQVVLKLRQIEVQTAQGKSLALTCKEAEISEQSYQGRVPTPRDLLLAQGGADRDRDLAKYVQPRSAAFVVGLPAAHACHLPGPGLPATHGCHHAVASCNLIPSASSMLLGAVAGERPLASGATKPASEPGSSPAVPSNPNSRLGRSTRSPLAQGWDQMDASVVGIDVARDRLDIHIHPFGV